jgi:cation/acetate symporter
MVCGLVFTLGTIAYFKSPWFGAVNDADHWLFGVSPEGIGVVGMSVDFAVAAMVAYVTKPTPESVRTMVDAIRMPGASR